MTQLLDPSGPYVCIWNDEVPCEVRPLIDMDTSGYAHSPACTISNFCDAPPIAPVPLPAGGLMLLSALAVAAVFRRLT